MQKVIFYLAVMLSVCMFSSCSSNDDALISLSEKEVTLKVDATQQIKATSDVSKWSSENDFIASVSESGMVTANHIGETRIMAQGSNGSAFCNVSVKPQYAYYMEPLCKEGTTKEDIKKFEKRNLHTESSDGLFYDGENSTVSAVAYKFDTNGKLNFVMLMLPHHYSTTLASQLINFLLERYNPLADFDRVYSFIDANKLNLANKIVYMEVSPKGYNEYICITYKVNTNK